MIHSTTPKRLARFKIPEPGEHSSEEWAQAQANPSNYYPAVMPYVNKPNGTKRRVKYSKAMLAWLRSLQIDDKAYNELLWISGGIFNVDGNTGYLPKKRENNKRYYIPPYGPWPTEPVGQPVASVNNYANVLEIKGQWARIETIDVSEGVPQGVSPKTHQWLFNNPFTSIKTGDNKTGNAIDSRGVVVPYYSDGPAWVRLSDLELDVELETKEKEMASRPYFQTRSLDQIYFVAIHNSAVLGIPADLDGLKIRLASHESYHKRKNYPMTRGEFGYSYLLYAFAVAGNGEKIQTQGLEYKLYHATDWYKGKESANQWGFGILLEGNFDKERPTQDQLEGAAQIIYNVNRKLGRRLIIKGHREYAAPSYSTGCPGSFMGVSTDLNSRLSWIINRVNELHGGAPLPPPENTVVVIAKTGLNVRSQPKVSVPSSANRVGVLSYGDIVKVTGKKSGAWLEIQYLGNLAWVHGAYVRAN